MNKVAYYFVKVKYADRTIIRGRFKSFDDALGAVLARDDDSPIWFSIEAVY